MCIFSIPENAYLESHTKYGLETYKKPDKEKSAKHLTYKLP